LFYAPKIAGDGKVPFAHAPRFTHAPLLSLRTMQFGPDLCVEAYLRDVYRK
jgi:riboflavin biosynthesis pyrimidine reductase